MGIHKYFFIILTYFLGSMLAGRCLSESESKIICGHRISGRHLGFDWTNFFFIITYGKKKK